MAGHIRIGPRSDKSQPASPCRGRPTPPRSPPPHSPTATASPCLCWPRPAPYSGGPHPLSPVGDRDNRVEGERGGGHPRQGGNRGQVGVIEAGWRPRRAGVSWGRSRWSAAGGSGTTLSVGDFFFFQTTGLGRPCGQTT